MTRIPFYLSQAVRAWLFTGGPVDFIDVWTNPRLEFLWGQIASTSSNSKRLVHFICAFGSMYGWSIPIWTADYLGFPVIRFVVIFVKLHHRGTYRPIGWRVFLKILRAFLVIHDEVASFRFSVFPFLYGCQYNFSFLSITFWELFVYITTFMICSNPCVVNFNAVFNILNSCVYMWGVSVLNTDCPCRGCRVVNDVNYLNRALC